MGTLSTDNCKRANMHITWTLLMRYWVPIIAKLCCKWKIHSGSQTSPTIFWMFLLSCLSSRQYKRLGGKSKWLHHLTSAVGGRKAVEATAQSVRWRTSVTVSAHGFTTRSIKLNTNTRMFCLNYAGGILFLHPRLSFARDMMIIEQWENKATANQFTATQQLTSEVLKYIYIKKVLALKIHRYE